jgi:hypothetical protein
MGADCRCGVLPRPGGMCTRASSTLRVDQRMMSRSRTAKHLEHEHPWMSSTLFQLPQSQGGSKRTPADEDVSPVDALQLLDAFCTTRSFGYHRQVHDQRCPAPGVTRDS